MKQILFILTTLIVVIAHAQDYEKVYFDSNTVKHIDDFSLYESEKFFLKQPQLTVVENCFGKYAIFVGIGEDMFSDERNKIAGLYICNRVPLYENEKVWCTGAVPHEVTFDTKQQALGIISEIFNVEQKFMFYKKQDSLSHVWVKVL